MLIHTDPDARHTSERDEIYAWLPELACPRDDPVHTHTSMFDGRNWSTGGQARARWHNAIMAAELDHLEETHYCAVVFVELWATSQIKVPAPTLWANPDAHPVPLLHM